MAYHNQHEYEAFQFILDHWSQLLEMKSPFKFLFVNCLDKELLTSFEHSFIEHQDTPGLKRWQNVSKEWAHVARYVAEQIDCTYWFWWEHDVLPVRKDCIEFFLERWHDQCQIMGYRVKDSQYGMRSRINGVAFYAKDYWKFMEPHFDINRPFDTNRHFCEKRDGNTYVELNKWYCLVHHEGPLMLTPNVRLVHGVKDHSLRDQIVYGADNYRPVSVLYRNVRNWLKIIYSNTGLRRIVKDMAKARALSRSPS
jgi:hypothetical protein